MKHYSPTFTAFKMLGLVAMVLLLPILILDSPQIRIAVTSQDARSRQEVESLPRGVKDPEALKHKISKQYGQLPLSFEINEGQTDPRVKFLSRGKGYSLFFTSTKSVLQLRSPEARMPLDVALVKGPSEVKSVVLSSTLLNSNGSAKVEGLEELPGKTNYFIGKDPKKWKANISNFSKIKYRNIYPGIDLIYYGNQQQLEHDFVIAPGGDPQDIAIRFLGGDQIALNSEGDLIIHTALGDVRQEKPLIYQESETGRQLVAGSYVIKNGDEIGFKVDQYDKNLELIIDPVLTYSTYLGGNGLDLGGGVAVDPLGQVVVAGSSGSSDFPIYNGYQTANANGDAFVTKLNATGSAIIYSTFVGGSGGERVSGLALDNVGNSYITGFTTSDDFSSLNGFSQSRGGQNDIFLAKLNNTGSTLLYASYLGGNNGDFGRGIAADDAGNAYVTGITDSANFQTKNALKTFLGGSRDGFVAKFDTNQSGSASLSYSTYIGGSGGGDSCEAVAVDPAGNIYLTGRASANDFPLKNGYQSFDDFYGTAFITKLDPSRSGVASLLYSSYFGGNAGEEVGYGIAVDALGRAYITGSTWSTDFPTRNPFQGTYGGFNGVSGHNDAFVTIFDTNQVGDASLLYSTYLGGNHEDLGRSIKVDAAGILYVSGDTSSGNFPLKDPIQGNGNGRTDVFITKLRPFVSGNSALLFSTYLGGSSWEQGNSIAIDNDGSIYVAGDTESVDFPTMNPLQTSFRGSSDAFVVKLFAASNFGALQFAQTSYGVNEGAGSVTLTVTRTGGTDGAISVQVNTLDATATSGIGNDYTGQASSLFWAAGDSSPKEITIPINDDVLFEGSEQFRVRLLSPTGGASVGEPNDVPVTISENDGAPVFGFQSLGQDEGNAISSNFGIFVTKTGSTAVTASLDYQTIAGTATPGSSCEEPGVDYVTTSGTLTFLPQETSKVLRIVVCGGTQPEPDETFTIPFVNPVNGVIPPGTGTSSVSIANDDKFAPTITASIASYTYDGTGHGASGSAIGIGDIVLSPAVTFTYSGSGATTYPISATPPSASGTYQVIANFAGNSNYAGGSSTPATYAINKATSTVTVTCPASQVYTGSAIEICTASYAGTGLLTGALVPVYTDNLNAGTATANASFGGDASHEGSSGSATFAITARSAAVKADPKMITYGNADPIFSYTPTGLVGTDTLTGVTCSVISAHTTVGTYSIICSGNTNPNYSVSYVDGTLTVVPKTVTVTASDQTITYGTADPLFSNTVTGLVGTETLTGVTCAVPGPHATVGTYTIVCSGNINNNYSVSYVDGTFTVNPKAVTVTASDQTTTYGNADPIFSHTVSGLVGMDTLTGVTCAVPGPHATVGTYSIICSGNTNPNYSVSYVDGTLTVIPKTVIVTADARSKIYGDADPSLTYTGTLNPGDSFTGSLARAVGENVGIYAITQNDLSAGVNYTIIFVGAGLTINKANATVTINGYTGTYDGMPHNAAGTATGVGGINLTSSINFGSTFTNVPGGTASWSFSGGTNYYDQTGSVPIVITKANPNCGISGFGGLYDGAPHGASGFCTGVSGPSNVLAGLNLGGTYTFVPGGTVNWYFTDITGNYTNTSGSVGITIGTVYCFEGFFSPIGGSVENGDGGSFAHPVKSFKLGSTIPVKFALHPSNNCQGTPILTGIHTLQAVRYSTLTDAEPPIDATPTDAATTGNQFRLSGAQWHYNLDTKQWQNNSFGTWLLVATLHDGSVHSVWISIKE